MAQLCEEGATQLFRPSLGNDLISGAVGPLQFEVASFRLRDEYSVDCAFEGVGVVAARWVRCDDRAHLDEFTKKLALNVAKDHAGELVYLAPSTVSLTLTQERWPKIQFFATRELATSRVTPALAALAVQARAGRNCATRAASSASAARSASGS